MCVDNIIFVVITPPQSNLKKKIILIFFLPKLPKIGEKSSLEHK